MADGIHALEGFDYQATVILELMLRHFDAHPEGQLRPEGADDVVLRWHEGSVEQLVFVQVKKPKTSDSGELTGEAWQLPAVARELMADAVLRLRKQAGKQLWVLGDEIEPRVRALLSAGAGARDRERTSYLLLLHLLARNASEVSSGLTRSVTMKLARWSPPPPSDESFDDQLRTLCNEFDRKLQSFGVAAAKRSTYRKAMHELNQDLPNLLTRIEARDAYGLEEDVRERVAQLFEGQRSFSRRVIDHTLLRNLRGFINDIAKQRGRWVTSEELELELRSVWPEMTPLRIPPPHEPGHVRRPTVISEVLRARPEGIVECLGVSGSGKTSVAAEIASESGGEPRFYIEVRQQTRFRDVLAGIAYGMRRYGERAPFLQVALPNLTEEEVLGRCANAFSSVARSAIVVIDLVEGECNDSFARDLGRFARQFAPGTMRWIFFAQHSPLRELSHFEKTVIKVHQCNLPGLSFEEWVALSGALNRSFDREQLWQVFDQMTAGRKSGLIPALAKVLLRSVDFEQLMQVAKLPAEQIVSAVEQQRFNQLPSHLRSAALRLVCLVLPFTVAEVEAIFPQESIRAAVSTLLALGLLRPLGDGQLEMHETIRRGMERLLPPAFTQETHTLLAAWYEQRDVLPAHIFHLEQSGRTKEAREKAVAAFKSRRYVPELIRYLRAHGLLPIDDIATWLEAGRSPNDYYLVQALASVAQPAVGHRMLSWVRAHAEKFDTDYEWAWKISEAILVSAPELIRELAEFALESSSENMRKNSRLERVRLAASRRLTAPMDAVLLPLFEGRSEAEKRSLVPLLLTFPGRAVLRQVLKYMAERGWPLLGQQRPGSDAVKLDLRTESQVEDFLAALPQRSVGQILSHRSALLEPFEEYIWSARNVLKPVTRQVVLRDEHDVTLLGNAIRVSIYLADEGVIASTEGLRKRPGPVQTLALSIPVFLDVPGWLARYEEHLLDAHQSFGSRSAVLPLLALLGADLDRLIYQVLAGASDEQIPEWRIVFLAQLPLRPFFAAVLFVLEFLKSSAHEAQAAAGFAFRHINLLPGPEVTDTLIAALQSPTPRTRALACAALARRRSPRALGPLMEMVRQDADPHVQRMASVAVLASGPRSEVDVQAIPFGSLDAILWRTVAVGRLRFVGQGAWLVQTALDSTFPWPVRRAAIFAASHLPFEAALQLMVPSVLGESAPLPFDNVSALGHALLSVLTDPSEYEAIQARLLQGQVNFVAKIGAIYDDMLSEQFAPEPFLRGTQAVGWLWGRLEQLGWREDATALRKVNDEVHVHILHAAVLRGLRLHGRAEELENILATASTEWIAARALMERLKIRPMESGFDRVERLVREGPFAESYSLRNMLSNIVPKASQEEVSRPAKPQPPDETRLTYDRIRELIAVKDIAVPVNGVAEINLDDELRRLVLELDPGNDYIPISLEGKSSRLSLTETGFALHPDESTRWVSNNRESRSKLRPLVAAANRFGLDIPWHGPLMSEEMYRKHFLQALVAHGDANRVFSVLEQYQELILPSLDGVIASRLAGLVDERILLFVSRFLNAGPPRVLEALCKLVSRIHDDRVLPILARLLARWAANIGVVKLDPFSEGALALKHSINVLAQHARFEEIPNWDDQIMDVLTHQMEFSHRQALVRIVRRSASAYAHLESLLHRTQPFEHYWNDEVDFLDDAAEELFARVNEE